MLKDKRKPDSSQENFNITFLPDNVKINISGDENLLEASRKVNIPLVVDCGGVGACGKCRLKLVEGEIESGGSFILTEREISRGFILACSSYPKTDLVVEVPESSMSVELTISGDIVRNLTGKDMPYEYSPLAEKVVISCNGNEDETISHLDRLFMVMKEKTGLREFDISYELIKKLPLLLKKKSCELSVTFSRLYSPPRILSLEKKDKVKECYGIALDIGTTSIEGILVDMKSGNMLNSTSHLNLQMKYGADIASRLNFASRNNGLMILSDLILDKVNEILLELVLESNVDKDNVYSIVISGNTIMIHFLLGLDISDIRKDPHIPSALVFPPFLARELSFYANPEAMVLIAPGVGSYVGGDLIFSILATGLPDENFVLVDIGTNGEVATAIDGLYSCSSTSAGSAFEGGGIKHGMRATPGAINRISCSEDSGDFTLMTIGNKPPKGICGTGLIDLLANLLIMGFIDKKGKFRERHGISRMRNVGEQEEFILALSDADEDIITITGQDIDYLIRSKGAIYTGVDFLLKKNEISIDEIDRFYVAGAMGGSINIENGIAIGLFPEIDIDRFTYLGNGSLHGGRMALLSLEAWKKSLEIARSAACFELNNEPGYMEAYTASLFLPHTNLNLFPGVVKKIDKNEREF
ncbi:MAG: ASKHA domain-containing protein [Candidatus Eremiobacteraeota bacterium]|nr:ASKHA domain-containing protein [Candidatus Eremiobacteraeota bacterium]